MAYKIAQCTVWSNYYIKQGVKKKEQKLYFRVMIFISDGLLNLDSEFFIKNLILG